MEFKTEHGNIGAGMDNLTICKEAAALGPMLPINSARAPMLPIYQTPEGAAEWYAHRLKMCQPDVKPKDVENEWYALAVEKGLPVRKNYMVCSKCMSNGTEDCRHKYGDVPQWHTEEKQQLLREIYKQLDGRLPPLKDLLDEKNIECI